MTFIPKHMKIHKLCIRSHTKKEKNIPRLALQFSSFGESEVRWKHIISGKLHYPQITSMYMRATFYFQQLAQKIAKHPIEQLPKTKIKFAMQNIKFFEILLLVLRFSVKPQRKLCEIISKQRKARVLLISETSSWCCKIVQRNSLIIT